MHLTRLEFDKNYVVGYSPPNQSHTDIRWSHIFQLYLASNTLGQRLKRWPSIESGHLEFLLVHNITMYSEIFHTRNYIIPSII